MPHVNALFVLRASQPFYDLYKEVAQVNKLWIVWISLKHGAHVVMAMYKGLSSITDWNGFKDVVLTHTLTEPNPKYNGPTE